MDPEIDGTPGGDVLNGTAVDDPIFGLGGDDKLFGLAGNDRLDGGTGADIMTGGLGDDTYFVEDKSDKVVEGAKSGHDTTLSSLDSYTLTVNVEDLTLTGTATTGIGNSLDNTIAGDDFTNHLDGAGGNDTIFGGFGNDVMLGGAGNDTLHGDSDDDELHGGAGDDTLAGDGGFDHLVGDAGNDTLDGGSGFDKMEGGAGNDSYFVDNAADQVIEAKNGGIDTVVTTLDTYTLADNLENLTLITAQRSFDGHGIGNALNNRIIGGDGHDTLEGGGGNDYLEGGNGNDTLLGGAGDDTLRGAGPNPDDIGQSNDMAGGAGNDFYVLETANDGVIEAAGEGIDTVLLQTFFTAGSDPFELADNVEKLILVDVAGSDGLAAVGNSLDNIITGGSGDNIIGGGEGKDKIDGGNGDDSLSGGEGSDTLLGGSGNDNLDGGGGDDTLLGGAGEDRLFGGAGTDTLIGGAGDDFYLLGDADKVIEAANGGHDAIAIGFATPTAYVLAANVEALGLFEAATSAIGNGLNNDIVGAMSDVSYHLDGGAGNDVVNGNDISDTLIGGTGDDQLDGRAGVDTMSGGAGDDSYTVDEAADTVIESARQGHDTVFSTATEFSLASEGANVEDLLFLTNLDVIGSGNGLDNEIDAAGGSDVLSGGAGNDLIAGGDGGDLLFGDAGNDTLDGGTGTDDLNGGGGNDSYVVDNLDDTVIEAVGGGFDTVKASTSYTLTAGQEIETLILTGTLGINGTGNEFANTITGNAGANVLTGGGGTDTLIGGEGADTYILDAGDEHDKIVETGHAGLDIVQLHFATATPFLLAAGVEQIMLSDAASAATGNALNNLMQGLDGTVSYHLDGGAGDDRVIGAGGEDFLFGGAGNDFLNGLFGADTMTGGAGNDTYRVDHLGDLVIEAKNGGTDTIETEMSFNLAVGGANVENLTLGDGGNFEGHGNTLNNVITGNSGANVLSGEAGNDVLEGGLGADTMDGGAGKDTFLYRLDGNGQLGMLGGDTINNFETGHDKIDVRDLFGDFGISEKGNPFTDGHLAVVDDGQGNTLVMFDADGSAGAGAAVTLATVTGHIVGITDIIH